MTDRRCDRCEFWRRSNEIMSEFPVGRCRRYPPKGGAQLTRDDDWCGEFVESPQRTDAPAASNPTRPA